MLTSKTKKAISVGLLISLTSIHINGAPPFCGWMGSSNSVENYRYEEPIILNRFHPHTAARNTTRRNCVLGTLAVGSISAIVGNRICNYIYDLAPGNEELLKRYLTPKSIFFGSTSLAILAAAYQWIKADTQHAELNQDSPKRTRQIVVGETTFDVEALNLELTTDAAAVLQGHTGNFISTPGLKGRIYGMQHGELKYNAQDSHRTGESAINMQLSLQFADASMPINAILTYYAGLSNEHCYLSFAINNDRDGRQNSESWAQYSLNDNPFCQYLFEQYSRQLRDACINLYGEKIKSFDNQIKQLQEQVENLEREQEAFLRDISVSVENDPVRYTLATRQKENTQRMNNFDSRISKLKTSISEKQYSMSQQQGFLASYTRYLNSITTTASSSSQE